MLARVPAGEAFSAWRTELELQINQGLRELDALRTREARLAQGPYHDLTLMQRLFVWFAPLDPRLWIIHALAYAFIAGGPLVLLLLVLFGIGDAGTIGDVMVMFVFGSLAFRGWALAERRWALASLKSADGSDARTPPESTPLQVLFVLRKSRSWRMLVAQICMWTCLFCAVESVEDIFLAALDASKAATQAEKATIANTGDLVRAQEAGKEARNAAEGGLLLLLAAVLGAFICRAWAAAEWLPGSPAPHPALSRTLFPMRKLHTSKAWLLLMSYVAAIAVLIVSIVEWSVIFKDRFDQFEFVFISVVVGVSSSRLLSTLGYTADNSKENRSAALVRSTAV